MGKLREMNRAYACALFLLCAATAIASPAQTLKTLISFNYTDGATPFWKYWNLLLRDSRHFDVTIADVAANADSDYFNNLGITPRNVIKVSREIQVAYKLNAVPTTIVLGPTGRVEGTWIGLLTNGRVREIETALLRN